MGLGTSSSESSEELEPETLAPECKVGSPSLSDDSSFDRVNSESEDVTGCLARAGFVGSTEGC